MPEQTIARPPLTAPSAPRGTWRRVSSASQISVGFRDQIDYGRIASASDCIEAPVSAREWQRLNLIARQGTMIAFCVFNDRLHEPRRSGNKG
jgi:hypothetical protein